MLHLCCLFATAFAVLGRASVLYNNAIKGRGAFGAGGAAGGHSLPDLRAHRR